MPGFITDMRFDERLRIVFKIKCYLALKMRSLEHESLCSILKNLAKLTEFSVA